MSASSENNSHGKRKSRVILISNNRSLTNSISKLIDGSACHLEICNNAKQVMGRISQNQPDLILCDSSLPITSGMNFARILKESDKYFEIPFFLLITPVPLIQNIKLSELKQSADEVVKYPSQSDDLKVLIDKWIELNVESPSFEGIKIDNLEETKKNGKLEGWKNGKVACSSMTRLFFNLFLNRESGVILVQDTKRKMLVFIWRGRIINVTSNYVEEDCLGTYLVNKGKITSEQHEESIERAKMTGQPQGVVLSQMGVLDTLFLEKCVIQHKNAKLLRLFDGTWNQTQYFFLPQKIEQSEYSIGSISPLKLIKEGVMDVAKSDDLYEIFRATKKTDHPLYLTRHFNKIGKLFRLERNSIEYVKMIDLKSMDDIKTKYSSNFDILLRLSFLLVLTKGARFASPDQDVRKLSNVEKAYITPIPRPEQARSVEVGVERHAAAPQPGTRRKHSTTEKPARRTTQEQPKKQKAKPAGRSKQKTERVAKAQQAAAHKAKKTERAAPRAKQQKQAQRAKRSIPTKEAVPSDSKDLEILPLGDILPQSDSYDSEIFLLSLMEARAYFDHGFFAEAMPILEKLVDMQPNNAEILAMFAWAIYKTSGGSKIDDIEEMLKKALKMDPENEAVYLCFGKLYHAKGDRSQALIHLEKALSINPQKQGSTPVLRQGSQREPKPLTAPRPAIIQIGQVQRDLCSGRLGMAAAGTMEARVRCRPGACLGSAPRYGNIPDPEIADGVAD